METSAHRAYFKVKECFSHPLLKNKLIIPGTNLERITMTVSIFTIVIVILQVVAEVLRVTSIDHKVSYTLSVEETLSLYKTIYKGSIERKQLQNRFQY